MSKKQKRELKHLDDMLHSCNAVLSDNALTDDKINLDELLFKIESRRVNIATQIGKKTH